MQAEERRRKIVELLSQTNQAVSAARLAAEFDVSRQVIVGDVALLRPGLAQIEALTGLPVVGVVPWLELDIDGENQLYLEKMLTLCRDKNIQVILVGYPLVGEHAVDL